jgi:hypothetical protein
MKRIYVVVATCLVSIFCSLVSAQLPGTIGYQGRLENTSGEPVSGTVNMVFSLFNSRSGGTNLWEESQPSLTVEDGYFSVSLGSITPFDLDFKSQYFLEIQVESDAPMSPRVKLDGTPYSQRAAAAPQLVVKDANGDSIGLPVGVTPQNFTMLTEEGFIYVVDKTTGSIGQAVQNVGSDPAWTTTDCTGISYYAAGVVGAGQVQKDDFGSNVGLVYAEKDAEPVTIRVESVWMNGACFTAGQFAQNQPNQLPFYPNDPSITGVDQESWPAPLRLEYLQQVGDDVRN